MDHQGSAEQDAATDPAPPATGAPGPATAAPHRHLAATVAQLSFTPRDPDELVELLQRAVDLAVSAIAGADLAGVTVEVGEDPFTAVCTDRATLLVDAHQYAAGDGPCLQARRTVATVRVDVATSEARWPEFTHDAEAVGIRSFLAAPLGDRDTAIGAINLYSRSADGFGDDDEDLLRLLADRMGQAVMAYARTRDLADLAEQMRAAMASRAAIEQAKGILVGLRRVTPDAAFDLLREDSQHRNVKLHTLAVELVAEHSAPRA